MQKEARTAVVCAEIVNRVLCPRATIAHLLRNDPQTIFLVHILGWVHQGAQVKFIIFSTPPCHAESTVPLFCVVDS